MLQNILDNDILKSLYFTELKMLDLIVNPYAGRGRAKTDAKKVFEILDANNVIYHLIGSIGFGYERHGYLLIRELVETGEPSARHSLTVLT